VLPGPAAPPGTAPGGTGHPPGSAAGVLGRYLAGQATAFLRAAAAATDGNPDGPARDLRRTARRIAAALHTYAPLTDPEWAEPLGAELRWLAATLAAEHRHAARLDHVLDALRALATESAEYGDPDDPGPARAAALLERQLGLARARAHSAALRALRSTRCHALTDAVALLASELPARPGAAAPAADILPALAGAARDRLLGAVAEALAAADAGARDGSGPDTAFHQARVRLRLHRYAQEVCAHDPLPPARLAAADRALRRHHAAAEAASAAAAAARTPRIAPSTAYTLGVLHAGRRYEARAALATFPRTWP
jgi:hypothetical protein